MTLRISLFQSAKDNAPQTAEVTWETLLKEFLTHETRAVKDGLAWSPARFEGTRANDNVREVSLAVFDLDDCSDQALAELGMRLEGWTYAVHSTFSPGCYRLILPLVAPIAPLQWREAWEAIRDQLQIPADPACRDPARLYYFPTRPPDGPEPIACDGTGKLFDVAALVPPKALALLSGQPISGDPVSPAKAADLKFLAPSQPIDLFDARKQLRSIRKAESARLVRLVLEGQSLQDEHGSRDDRMNRIASILATGVSPPLAWEGALEILRPSLNATPQERAGHLEHWVGEMRDMFERALERRRKSDAKDEELRAALRATLGRSVPQGQVASESSIEESWRSKLLVTTDSNGEPAGLKQVGANAGLILRCDPSLVGNIRFNEVTKAVDCAGPFEAYSKNSLEVEVGNWLAYSRYALNLNSKVVAEQLLAVSRRNAYDPLALELAAVAPVWDGQRRLESLFPRYFGAIGNPQYLAAIGRVWMIGAVARALNPGCKNDTVLVLQGAQGKLKSTALSVLGGEYFSDTKFNIHDKDGRMMASRFWIIELGEMANMRKADAESLKAFFSARRDDIRVPYGRVLESFPRRCIFVVTLNDADEYLSDPTGNRRYLPVKITSIDLEALTADRTQLWAEAVTRYRAGEQWWLEGEEVTLQSLEAADVTRASPYTESILQWWLKLNHRPDSVTSSQVASEALGMLTAQITGGVQQEIGHALRSLGFIRGKKRFGGKSLNCFHTPQTMKDETKLTTAQIIQMAK